MLKALLIGVVLVMLVWGIRLLAQQPAGRPTLPVTGTGAVSGVVSDGTTGRPIPGAIVALRTNTGAPLARITKQLTDALGRFVFRDLAAAPYTLAVSRLGFVDGAYGQAAMLGPTGTINLKDGQWFDRADVLLWKPGAISGRILDEHNDPVVGTYVRVLAQQMIGGQLKFLAGPAAKTDDRGVYRIAKLPPGRYVVTVPSVQSTVSTDLAAEKIAQPTFRPGQDLERQLMGFNLARPQVDGALDLDPANRLVIGNFMTPPVAANGRQLAYPMTFFPGVNVAAAATSIELRLGEERQGADIVIQPVPAVRVSGSVTGSAGQISGLILRMMPAGLEELAVGSEGATTTVGSDGHFTFLNVPSGSYTIDARRATSELTFQSDSGVALPPPPGAQDMGFQSGEIVSGPPGSGVLNKGGSTPDLYFTRTSVTVGTTDLTNLVVPMQRSVSLSGRMVFEGTARAIMLGSQGGAVGAGGTPALAAPVQVGSLPTVYAEPANADMSLGVIRSSRAEADANGGDVFSMDGLRSGKYVLRVPQAQNLGRYAVKSIVVAGQDVTNAPIDTSAMRNLTDVVITFTDQFTTVSGFVQGDEARMSEAAVIAFPVERDQWTGYGLTPVRIMAAPMSATTGYQLRGLPPGDYYLVAVELAQITAWQDPKFLERAAGVATRVKLGLNQPQITDLKLARIR
jgi:hypothetical protein